MNPTLKDYIDQALTTNDCLTSSNLGTTIQIVREASKLDASVEELDGGLFLQDPANFNGYLSTSKELEGWKDTVFVGYHGYWYLKVYKELACDYWSEHLTFDIAVNTAGLITCNRYTAKKSILAKYNERVYEAWRQVLLATYFSSICWIMNKLQASHSGLKAWSLTTSEGAERLMERTPNVHLYQGVAFLSV